MPLNFLLCTNGNHFCPDRLSPEGSKANNEKDSLMKTVIQLLTPQCLRQGERKTKRKFQRVEDHHHHHLQQQQQLKKARQLTLEEWFRSSLSIGIGMDSSPSGEHSCQCRQHHSCFHPTVIGEGIAGNSSADSVQFFSLEKLLKDEDFSAEEMSMSSQFHSVSSIRRRSLSRKSERRVSFKLPEEADVVVFHSPTSEFERA